MRGFQLIRVPWRPSLGVIARDILKVMKGSISIWLLHNASCDWLIWGHMTVIKIYVPAWEISKQLWLYFHVTLSQKRSGNEVNVMVGGIGCDRNELVCVTWKYNHNCCRPENKMAAWTCKFINIFSSLILAWQTINNTVQIADVPYNFIKARFKHQISNSNNV